MTYQEAEAYLLEKLPMFQRQGAIAFKKDLTNICKLCEVLGNPQDSFPSVHIAGTNGKGSTAHMMASYLQEAGYFVGLYTSPHLKRYTERIRINGKEISEEAVANFVERNQSIIEKINPSFFEVTVALAFWYFANEKVDIAVVETGMGGRLDSTNILNPILSVITTIGFDHQAFLGNTLAEIAGEKAGIIKQNTPLVVGHNKAEAKAVFANKALEMEAPLIFAQEYNKVEPKEAGYFDCYCQHNYMGIQLDLLGDYQQANLSTALCARDTLNKYTDFEVSNEAMKSGLENVVENTGLKGRWQILQDAPMIVADTAHNEMGIQAVVNQAKALNKNVKAVVGITKEKLELFDKDIWPKDWQYYFCCPENPRCIGERELLDHATRLGFQNSKAFPSVMEAYQTAKQQAKAEDLVLVTGSTFTVAEIEDL